jgi:hypothetical protein
MRIMVAVPLYDAAMRAWNGLSGCTYASSMPAGLAAGAQCGRLANRGNEEDPMSEDGFHVHGPHDHELEHAAQHGAKGMAGQLAVITAILATVGATFSYMGGATQANAGLYKNNAAIKKTEAGNQWGYYQAKGNKQNLAELAAELVPTERKAAFQAEAARYKAEKIEIKAQADKLEAEASEWDEKSAEQMHQHHRWAMATTALQIAIALAAIALLTGRKWLEYAVFGVSGLGLALGLLAWFQH